MKRYLCLIALTLSLTAAGVAAGEAVFKVGFAKADVTPPAPMPMWGYGDRHAALSTGVLDPLYAKAVVIDIGTDKLAIVGLDLGRSPMTEMMDTIMERVKTEAGVNHVLMSGSHTHHGPVLELSDEEGKGKGVYDDGIAYIESLQGTLVGVIVDAAKNVQDARIGWGTAQVDMNRNRHTDFEPKPRDTELNVLRFDKADGELLALVVNFAAHPTMLPGEDLRFSAEYPGQMMNAVEAETGAQCVFMQGAAGDMSTKTTEATS
ncbi:MAG: neutral/alkaline non-lysosomal ceramidase N-terminal domain-containing protein, partial [Candidatus Hydrogenedentales bacterium]